jgi:ADP-ribosylglycohydrolase
MLGAIIGDIVGSRFEFNNHRNKDFDLFTPGCFFTDDSVMTLAVAKAIMACGGNWDRLEENAVTFMREIGRKYPNCGFGGMFRRWIFSDDPMPYNSFGNGAAMRVSPCAFAAATEEEALLLARKVTAVTHNHEEGLKGAEATTLAIFMARRGALKNKIRSRIERDYYPLDFTLDSIRDAYAFNETCQETVPQAIVAFLESTSFEDAIRNAISIGGDSDTIAAITGAIAEAYYGVPDWIKEKALAYLDANLRAIYDEWTAYLPLSDERFKILTKYIGKLNTVDWEGNPMPDLGKWTIDHENDGTPEHPIQMPFVGYSALVISFEEEFCQFSKIHPEYDLTGYGDILKNRGIPWSSREMHEADVSGFDEQGVLALIMGAIRAERFCDGALLTFFKDGSMSRWLKRLRDIDWQRSPKVVQEISFGRGGYFGGADDYKINFKTDGAELTETIYPDSQEVTKVQRKTRYYSQDEAELLQKRFAAVHTEYWTADYYAPVCDGEQWNLTVRYSDRTVFECNGSNAYPEGWNNLLDFFGIEHTDQDETDE